MANEDVYTFCQQLILMGKFSAIGKTIEPGRAGPINPCVPVMRS